MVATLTAEQCKIYNEAQLAFEEGQALLAQLNDQAHAFNKEALLKRMREYHWLLQHADKEHFKLLKEELFYSFNTFSGQVENPWTAKTAELIQKIALLKQHQQQLVSLKAKDPYSEKLHQQFSELLNVLENKDLETYYAGFKNLEQQYQAVAEDASKEYLARFHTARIGTIKLILKDAYQQLVDGELVYKNTVADLVQAHQVAEARKAKVMNLAPEKLPQQDLDLLTKDYQKLEQKSAHLKTLIDQLNKKSLSLAPALALYQQSNEMLKKREEKLVSNVVLDSPKELLGAREKLASPIKFLLAQLGGGLILGKSYRDHSFYDSLMQCLPSLEKNCPIKKLHKYCKKRDFSDNAVLLKLCVQLDLEINLIKWIPNGNRMQVEKVVYNKGAKQSIRMAYFDKQFVPILSLFPCDDADWRNINNNNNILFKNKFANRLQQAATVFESAEPKNTEDLQPIKAALASLRNYKKWSEKGPAALPIIQPPLKALSIPTPSSKKNPEISAPATLVETIKNQPIKNIIAGILGGVIFVKVLPAAIPVIAGGLVIKAALAAFGAVSAGLGSAMVTRAVSNRGWFSWFKANAQDLNARRGAILPLDPEEAKLRGPELG